MTLNDRLMDVVSDTDTPEEIAEAGIGLIARAAYRAGRISKTNAVALLSDVSSFTTKLHIEARK